MYNMCIMKIAIDIDKTLFDCKKSLVYQVLNSLDKVMPKRHKEFKYLTAEDVVRKVAKSILAFNALNIERHKDAIFDIEKAFSFEGETAPYMQYTYTRLQSILRKYEEVDGSVEIIKKFTNEGHQVAFLSSRPNMRIMNQVVISWLQKHDLPHDFIVVNCSSYGMIIFQKIHFLLQHKLFRLLLKIPYNSYYFSLFSVIYNCRISFKI